MREELPMPLDGRPVSIPVGTVIYGHRPGFDDAGRPCVLIEVELPANVAVVAPLQPFFRD